MLDRRRLLQLLGVSAAGLASGSARAENAADTADAAAAAGLDEVVLEVPGESLARRCQLFVPRAKATQRVLVLFHGLGETGSEAVGIRAWADRYGLLSAAARLRRPPVARTLPGVPLLTEARLAELNRELGVRPFRGLALACPYTPNVFKQPSTAAALERYTAWVVDGLLPEIARTLAAGTELVVGVDGVSLGGFVSLEVFLRRPEAFRAVGGTQAALGMNLVDAYAARFQAAFERVGPRPLRLATSAWDPERKTSERLAKRLAARDIDVELATSPGGHDQRFLREVGSLELLHHYDRVLEAGRAGKRR